MFALQYFAFIRDDGEVSGVYFTAWAAEVMLLALVAIVDIIIVDLSTRMGINYFSSNNVARVLIILVREAKIYSILFSSLS